jgi:ribosomal protein S18 acetylase RimI-like enzyme
MIWLWRVGSFATNASSSANKLVASGGCFRLAILRRCRYYSTDGDGKPLNLRAASSADAPAAAEMAERVLHGSLLAQLGTPFLTAFYRVALSHPATVSSVAFGAHGQPLGFALATSDVHAFHRYVRPRVALRTLQALLSPGRISLVPNFVRSLTEGEPEPEIPAELLLLYVEPDAHRRGTGRQLISSIEQRLAEVGAARYRVAVRSQLAAARAFYLATGFTFEQERLVLGEPMTYFTRQL